MAGNGSRGGSSRSAGQGGASASSVKSVKVLASVSQNAFERRYQRAGKDRMTLRRYEANADRPHYSSESDQRRMLQTNATGNRARAFYEGLRTNRATGMPQSLQAGFADRQRFTTGTKKTAGRKRSRLVKA